MTGRPSSFTQKKADVICRLLVEGKSLRSICKADEMPDVSTVCKWLNDFPDFAKQYARAREAQADALADEILDIADDGTADTIIGEDGVERINQEVVARSRLRVDARKWYASKLAPKKYGEKIEATHQGPNGGPVQIEEIRRTVVDPAKAPKPE